MFAVIEKLADRALSRIVPKADAFAYKAGCRNYCDAVAGCSEWECCRVGAGVQWQRSCPRTPYNPAGGCYLSFNGRC